MGAVGQSGNRAPGGRPCDGADFRRGAHDDDNPPDDHAHDRSGDHNDDAPPAAAGGSRALRRFQHDHDDQSAGLPAGPVEHHLVDGGQRPLPEGLLHGWVPVTRKEGRIRWCLDVSLSALFQGS
jgi:hypothetical protein